MIHAIENWLSTNFSTQEKWQMFMFWIGAVLAPCLLAGRMLGPGRLVQFRRIGLDQPEEHVPTMVTQRDIRRKESRSRAAASQRFHI